jgi:hypothetical protein
LNYFPKCKKGVARKDEADGPVKGGVLGKNIDIRMQHLSAL